jgi:hypothetical protein
MPLSNSAVRIQGVVSTADDRSQTAETFPMIYYCTTRSMVEERKSRGPAKIGTTSILCVPSRTVIRPYAIKQRQRLSRPTMRPHVRSIRESNILQESELSSLWCFRSKGTMIVQYSASGRRYTADVQNDEAPTICLSSLSSSRSR